MDGQDEVLNLLDTEHVKKKWKRIYIEQNGVDFS